MITDVTAITNAARAANPDLWLVTVYLSNGDDPSIPCDIPPQVTASGVLILMPNQYDTHGFGPSQWTEFTSVKVNKR